MVFSEDLPWEKSKQHKSHPILIASADVPATETSALLPIGFFTFRQHRRSPVTKLYCLSFSVSFSVPEQTTVSLLNSIMSPMVSKPVSIVFTTVIRQ